MSQALVTYELVDHVAMITLNRPEAINAMSIAMLQDLHKAADRFAADGEARVAVVSGEGRAFCTGGDVKESVHGYAIAGGILLANACHVIIAEESVKFGIPETKVGMPTMGYIDLWKTMGPRKLLEYTLTGDNFTAEEARDMGLINQVVPDGTVREAAVAMATKIAANSPTSVRGHVEAITLSIKHTPEVLSDQARSIWDKVVFGEDLQEGLTAFGERRKPVWKNR
jgi:enoyl-CoA hydratase